MKTHKNYILYYHFNDIWLIKSFESCEDFIVVNYRKNIILALKTPLLEIEIVYLILSFIKNVI